MKDTQALRQGAPQGPAQDHMLPGLRVWVMLLTHHPLSLFQTPPEPGPNAWVPMGQSRGRLLEGNWIPGRANCQGAEQPLCRQENPLPAWLPFSQQPELKSDLGGCRGLGCYLNAPIFSCPLPQGLLHLPPKPPRYDFPSLMGGPRAQTQVYSHLRGKRTGVQEPLRDCREEGSRRHHGLSSSG